MEVNTFKAQFGKSRLVFLLILIVVLCVHLVLVNLEMFGHNDLMKEINIMALFLESVVLLTSFLVYGAILVVDIRRYYEKRYSA